MHILYYSFFIDFRRNYEPLLYQWGTIKVFLIIFSEMLGN